MIISTCIMNLKSKLALSWYLPSFKSQSPKIYMIKSGSLEESTIYWIKKMRFKKKGTKLKCKIIRLKL